ncbi:MAG: hypothetical protein EA351_02840 [Gemmatimonadales bacterium]|nr:MAG: hypothetical protein EA351_02840 [Gemmatimonadales bacterium]
MSLLIAAVALAGCIVLYVLHPLLTGGSASMEEDHHELTEAQHQKRIALLGLRDVEYDFHAGKLDESDYRRLKTGLAAEALEAMESESRELRESEGGTLSAEVEDEIEALRTSLREGTICHECGEPNPRGSRFCGECGTGLSVTRETTDA